MCQSPPAHSRVRPGKKKEVTESTRTDGRKAMLVYLRPGLIEAIKDAAKAGHEKAWQVVERAMAKALKWKEEP
jgi:hypothetical protein